ncbi:MAG TPA: O-methyltransferase [Planctomycetota bacterium]|nr:O-methyltransferase [Planctomycetota bacterium]
MEIVPRALEDYLLSLHPRRPPEVEELERRAAETRFPIIGPLVGALCELLARSIGARRVLELGSGFGYSAWWFARSGARVVLTEYDARNLEIARRLLGASDCEYHAGDALEILPRLEGEFDLIFCDIDKADYPRAWKAALPRLRKGGLFVTDNVFWHGEVLSSQPDADARGVLEYNRLAFSTPGVRTSIVPLRDGVAVSLKT